MISINLPEDIEVSPSALGMLGYLQINESKMVLQKLVSKDRIGVFTALKELEDHGIVIVDYFIGSIGTAIWIDYCGWKPNMKVGIPLELEDWGKTHHSSISLNMEYEKMTDHYASRGIVIVNEFAAWRNWLRNASSSSFLRKPPGFDEKSIDHERSGPGISVVNSGKGRA